MLGYFCLAAWIIFSFWGMSKNYAHYSAADWIVALLILVVPCFLFYKYKTRKKDKKDEIIESGASYMGYATVNIGPIIRDSIVTIKMYPKEQKITLSANKDKLLRLPIPEMGFAP